MKEETYRRGARRAAEVAGTGCEALSFADAIAPESDSPNW